MIPTSIPCSPGSSTTTDGTTAWRSGFATPPGEDAGDLNAVVFDTDLFSALYRGYLSQAGRFLTEADHKYLFDAIHLIPLELAIRFFADYLAGDVY